jgi:hypothetical protein
MGKIYAFEYSVLGDPGYAMVSQDDGTSWRYGDTLISHAVSSVGWDGSNFCVLPYNTNIVYITPDATYTRYGTMPVAGNWNSIAWGNRYCAIIKDSTIGAVSQDGLNWMQVTLPSMGPSGDAWKEVIWTGSYFMIIGVDVELLYTITAISSDGVIWVDRRVQEIPNDLAFDHRPKLLTYANKAFSTTGYGEGGVYNVETSPNIFTNQINVWGFHAGKGYHAVGRDTIVFCGSNTLPIRFINFSHSQLGDMPQSISTGIFNTVVDVSTIGPLYNSLVFGVVWTGSVFLILTYGGVLRSRDMGVTWEQVDYSTVPPPWDYNYPFATNVLIGSGTIELDPPAFWTDLQQTKQTF